MPEAPYQKYRNFSVGYFRLFQGMAPSLCGFQDFVLLCFYFLCFLNVIWTRREVWSVWEKGRECAKPLQDLPGVTSCASLGLIHRRLPAPPRGCISKFSAKNSSLFLPLVSLLWSINLGINLKLAEQGFGRDEMWILNLAHPECFLPVPDSKMAKSIRLKKKDAKHQRD